MGWKESYCIWRYCSFIARCLWSLPHHRSFKGLELAEPDEHYQNNWTMGQISRYLGRDMARVIGFFTGIFFIVIGIYFAYKAFTYKG